jgi:sulfate adenylyltransferase subunit 1
MEHEMTLLKFITCGSVDDGKSTLIGHILYDAKLLYADQKQALIMDSRVGSRAGKIDYSLLLDGLMAEREQGITIDVAYRYFTTARRSFIVADTPGHEEYTRNMAVGASFADLALILIDAAKGVLTQTRRHARICKLCGIRSFVFAVNKMDLAGYKEDVFNTIKTAVDALKDELGLAHVVIIPVSATEGDNLTRKSDNMNWYKGDTLLDCLETVDVRKGQPESGFVMPVQRVSRPDHTFRGFQGQVEAGTVRVGDMLDALPSGERARVKSLIVAGYEAQEASLGQPLTICLDREVDISRGCVLAKDAALTTGRKLSATVLWMDKTPLTAENDYWIKIGTKFLPAVVSAIRSAIDVNTGEPREAESVEANMLAEIDIELSEPCVVDLFSAHKVLGSFILIDRVSHATSACGTVFAVDEETVDAVKDNAPCKEVNRMEKPEKIDYKALKDGGFMRQIQKDSFSLRLKVVGGDVSASQLETIVKVARKFGQGRVHLTSRQGVEIPFIRLADIDAVKADLKAGGVDTGVCGPRVRTVTACQGSAVCPSGCIDTATLAKEISARYFGRTLPHKFKFGVTGCMNNCLKAEENDLGVKGGAAVSWCPDKCDACGVCVKACREGAITLRDKEIVFSDKKCSHCGRCAKACPFDAWEAVPGYILSFAGTFGNHIARGEQFLPLIHDNETLFRASDAALSFFDRYGKPGERFRVCVDRTGWEQFRAFILDAIQGGTVQTKSGGKASGENAPETEGFTADASVDITDVVCPTTFAKAKVALDELPAGQVLAIRMNDGEPAQNVPRSMKDEGHQVLKLINNSDGTYTLLVRRGAD